MKDFESFIQKLEKIKKVDPGFDFDAYSFVMQSLQFTVSKLDKPRHITGQELLEGIRSYALVQFGPMARTVLSHWGITKTQDFGQIVFDLVEVEILSKQPNDSIEDFKKGYDFKEAFDRGYVISDDPS